MIFARVVPSKGVQTYAVKRFSYDLGALGHAKVITKSDGEPAIRSLQAAVKSARTAATHTQNSPARDAQANGVAERAVREFTSVLRRIKLGLEYRVKAKIDFEHRIMEWVSQHTGFVISHYLTGTQDGFTAFRRKFEKNYEGVVCEFGELIWAKPRATWRRDRSQPSALASRAFPGVWVGVCERTGENLVLSLAGFKAVVRVRTVMRRPLGERWSAEAVLSCVATPRVPDP